MDDAWAPGEFEKLRDGLERAWHGVESALASLRDGAEAPKAVETTTRAERDKAYCVYATASHFLDSRKNAPSPNVRVVVRGAIRKLARFEAAMPTPEGGGTGRGAKGSTGDGATTAGRDREGQ